MTLLDRWGWPLRRFRWIEVAWAAFGVLNLGAMVVWGAWETVFFHFIWVSLTLLYGFRVWRMRTTLVLLAVIIVTTGSGLIYDYMRGLQPLDETTEVPLMSAMFFVMVWHARRRLTAMQRLERLSEHNLRLLDSSRQLVQDASHELRTPITVALGHAQLLERELEEGPHRADATVMTEELLRLRRLVDKLLTLAASEDPDFLHRTPVELDRIVLDAFRRWSATPRDWRLRDVHPAAASADADRLAAALDAVIENAVQHTREGARIELGLGRDNGLAVIRVTDSGPGIQVEDRDRIFTRFARGDRGRSRNTGGAGLGLAMVKAVVEAHGGTVAAGGRPGRGAVFELRLPVVPGAPAAAAASE